MKTIATDLASYEEHFIDTAAATDFFRQALVENYWVQESIKLFGKTVLVPRLVAWQGEQGINYRYSGADHHGKGFSPLLTQLKQWVEHKTQHGFNFALINMYRDGEEYMGFHSDHEKSLGDQPIIASLSFGASRRFVYKNKKTNDRIELSLKNGSLLLMHETQKNLWQHSLPKQKAVALPRLNVSFRQVKS